MNISAGKYWTAAVTDIGDVFMWDGKNMGEAPILTRLNGIKHATSVSVGETHLLAVCALYHPSCLLPNIKVDSKSTIMMGCGDELEELDGDFIFNDTESNNRLSGIQDEFLGIRSLPSLKSLCEKMAIEFMLEPRNAVQLLEIADTLAADDLGKNCEVLGNTELILFNQFSDRFICFFNLNKVFYQKTLFYP